MKKNYFTLIVFIMIMIINYSLNHYIKQDYTENLNNIDFIKILKQSLHPSAVFLFMTFFYKTDFKAKTFALFIVGYIIIEFIFRYFKGVEIIEYNYVIGMIIGLIFVIIIDWIKEKIVIDKS